MVPESSRYCSEQRAMMAPTSLASTADRYFSITTLMAWVSTLSGISVPGK
jgi:hypothetical protein